MFLERLGVFDYANNKYYVPSSKFNTSSATSSIAIPNCTTYAMMRANELLESDARLKDIARKGSVGFSNAKYWFTQTGYPTGSEIKTGSIAVFDGNCGHVAIVERKVDDTHAIISESNYDDDKSLRNYKFFRSRQVELVVGKATLAGVGKLLGFIYLSPNDKRVSRDTSKDQIEVFSQKLNVRKTPNGELFSTGLYCPIGIYNIMSTKKDGNYTWYKLDDDMWVAGVADTVTYYAKSKDLDSENKLLRETLKQIHDIIENVI